MATPRGAEHRDLEQRLRNMERQLRDLSGQVLRQRKLQVTAGDFPVSGGGSVGVTDGGSVLVSGGGSVEVVGGGSVDVSGGGQVTVDGTALVAVNAGTARADCLNVSLTATDAVKMSATLAVPAGYSRAVVIAQGFMSAVNGSGANDYLRAHINVAGTGPAAHDASSPLTGPSGSGVVTAVATRLVSGLPTSGASVVTVDFYAHSQSGGWGSNNFGNLEALAVFLR